MNESRFFKRAIAPSLALTAFAVIAHAQDTTARPEGITTDWDVKGKMAAMHDDVGRIEDLLNRARPHEWIAKGAPDAYVQQLESSKASLQLLLADTKKLSSQPDKLPVALETLFRMDSMDMLLNSLREGIRRYQGPSLADDIARFISDNSRHRDMLRQHSVDLASLRESEYNIIHSEAQRCRTELARKDAPETQQRVAPAVKPAQRRRPK